MRRGLGKITALVAVVSIANHVSSRTHPMPDEERAISYCLTLVRDCQLPDGAFNMKKDGPVWIQPYFANHAALALIAGKRDADLAKVTIWLQWYASHQRSDGSIHDFVGDKDSYQDCGKTDATDSTAATFLIVVAHYQEVKRELPKGVLEAAKKALIVIQSVVDPEDGLTWAHTDYKVKYLMDNLEVYGGLASAEKLFSAVGDQQSAKDAGKMREALARSLPNYYQDKLGEYTFALMEDGKYETAVPSGALGTECLANLFALSWLPSENKPTWKYLQSNFKPDSGTVAQAPAERWYMAALRTGTKEQTDEYKKMVIEEALRFKSDNIYLHQPAVTALALLEGYGWMPSLADGKP